MLNKKIIILGSKGMLGQMVKSYFTTHEFEIIVYDKRFSEDNISSYLEELNSYNDGIVINCIGRIKQKSEETLNLLWSNTILPLLLARSLKSSHILIHPSTDCVFDGYSEVSYNQLDEHTARDIYGISKSLGETAISSRQNSLVVRVSIIGPDNNSDKGLLSWFLSNSPNAELKGFTNHFWNGITTLEWCKRLHSFIQDQDLFDKLLINKQVQLGTETTYTKFQMLNIFNKTFSENFNILPFEADSRINRCLKPDIVSKSLEEQMLQLLSFMKK
jgi:dTDP-4-dehydrorhamnose reductase